MGYISLITFTTYTGTHNGQCNINDQRKDETEKKSRKIILDCVIEF